MTEEMAEPPPPDNATVPGLEETRTQNSSVATMAIVTTIGGHISDRDGVGKPTATENIAPPDNPPATYGTTTTGLTAVHEGATTRPAIQAGLSVLKVLPHDAEAFTQGLVFRNGWFYESTGLYGRSSIRIVDPLSGVVLASVPLDSEYFGEGLEVVGDRVVQLTWMAGVAFVWDAQTLAPIGTYRYEGEGWGLCALADRFVMSNGSSSLTFRDLETFEVIGHADVHFKDEPIDNLNELECVEGLVYANVWFSDEVMVILPDTGEVVARIDGAPLREQLSSTEDIDVLNGIAYDARREVFYMTGKLWPEIFEVQIAPVP